MTNLQLGQIAIDADQADQLAAFYARLVGRPVNDGASPYFAVIPADPETGFPALMFLKVPEPRTAKNRIHLDLTTDDPSAAVARALELGAGKVADFDEYGTQWTTLTDPEGNVFDIGLAHPE